MKVSKMIDDRIEKSEVYFDEAKQELIKLKPHVQKLEVENKELIEALEYVLLWIMDFTKEKDDDATAFNYIQSILDKHKEQ